MTEEDITVGHRAVFQYDSADDPLSQLMRITMPW